MLANRKHGDRRQAWRDLKEDFFVCYSRALDLLMEERCTPDANHYKDVFELLMISTLKGCNAMTAAERKRRPNASL